MTATRADLHAVAGSVDDPELLADIVGTLTELADADSANAGRADEALAGLRKRWPNHVLRLVRDRDTSDDSVSHDVLIQGPTGTVSLAYSAHPARPWPLRGAIRHADSTLLRIDETELRVEDALGALDTLWNSAPVLTRLIDTTLVRAELDRAPAIVDDHQRQEAADAFRRAKGFLTAEATHQWLRDTGLGPAGFAALVESTASMHALRRRVAEERLEGWLAAHAAEFDRLTVAWVESDQVDGGPLGGDETQARATVAQYVQSGRRAGVTSLRAELAPAGLGTALPGDVVATEIDGIPATAMVLVREPDRSDEGRRAARERAEQAIFDEWLADARSRATVEWCWLDVDRTTPAG